jgi:WD40 repeat protein
MRRFTPQDSARMENEWSPLLRGTRESGDAATGKAIGQPMKHDDEEASARFSPDGSRVVTASWDTARVWDVASVSGKETARAALVARRSHVKPDAFVGPKPH